MTIFREGELELTFGPAWRATRFDEPGTVLPPCIRPVDFVAMGREETVLVEVKGPSASSVPLKNRTAFIKKMQTRVLTHEELTPKARTTYGFLHLMMQDEQPMRYVVVIGTERLSIQPPLLMNLADRLRHRLAHEASEPWKRRYLVSCSVVSVADLGKVLPGCSARRTQPDTG
jgi:hypothetical protein